MTRKLDLPSFLFINGPPGSGKSTLASLLCAANPHAWRESFAEPIRQMIYSVFLPEQGPIGYDIDLRLQKVKSMQLAELARLYPEGGFVPACSVRNAMILFSEEFMKKIWGQDVLGRLLWNRCVEQTLFYEHFIIDDSGFAPEAEYIIQKAGAANCRLVRLHREGCNFRGDSRGYIRLAGLQEINIRNDGTPEDMFNALVDELNITSL